MKAKFEHQFSLTASKAYVEKFEAFMAQFAKFEHIQVLRDEVVPKMEHFTDLMDKYSEDNLDMRMCVRKFDQDLSLKANKCGIVTLREELEVGFVAMHNWKSIEKVLQAND